MMEHVEWCPEGYQVSGIAGQRIAVAGHSHWSEDPDHEAFTDECLRKVISGEWRIAFFTVIARYFGFEDKAAFWSSVLFFNFLPTKVGIGKERFNHGREDQAEAGRERVLRILDQHRPEKLFVFSRKAWQMFPPTLEDHGMAEPQSPLFWQTYVTPGDHRVKAIGLRHPQGASREEMTAEIAKLMKG